MPAGNRTGPEGMGPMTGRGAGHCAGYETPGYMNSVPGGRGRSLGPGRGMGFGAGRGRRFGYFGAGVPGFARFPASPSAAVQNPEPGLTRQALQSRADNLSAELEEIKRRLDSMEEDKAEE